MVAHDDPGAHFLALLWISVALCGYPFLITWRMPAGLAGTVSLFRATWNRDILLTHIRAFNLIF